MKRKPKKSRTEDHVEYLEAILEVAEAHPRVRALRFGEVTISMGADPNDLPEAIGFETPAAGEPEYEPEETRRKRKRRRAG